MPARILSLVGVSQRQPRGAPAPVAPCRHPDARFHFWRGASGRRYVHSVYDLITCPPLPEAIYVLARRDRNGRCVALQAACACSNVPSLNLARIRQRGATLGANEVHVHFLAVADEQRQLILCDLRAGQFGALGAEGLRAVGD
jgi:hypothetical protein